MSVGPLGMAGSVTGGIPQIRNADAGHAEKLTTDQARQAKSDQQAEDAAGVGETAQDEKASDRDADGRRLWEGKGEPGSDPSDLEEAVEEQTPQSKDPTGNRGSQLDLSG